MPVESVQFSGTLSNQNTVTEKTQSKFEGTGKIVSPLNRTFTIALTVSITVTLTLALTFKFIFNFDFDQIFKLFETSAPPQKTQVEPPAEPLVEPPAQILPSPGINGYVVVVRVFDNGADAMGLQYSLRQKRVNAKYRFHDSQHFVYVGPIYARNSANSTLQIVRELGYDEAYVVTPGE